MAEETSQVGESQVGDVWVGAGGAEAGGETTGGGEGSGSMRSEIKQATVSGVVPTPIKFSAMDATSVSTTLSEAATALQSFLIVGSLSGLNLGDYLLVSGAERATVLTLPDGSSIASSAVAAGGSGYIVGDIGHINGGNADALYVVDTVSSGAVVTYHLLATGSAYSSGSGRSTTRSSGAGTGFTVDITASSGHTVNVTRGVSNTAAVAHASAASVLDISVGNIIKSITVATDLLFFNSDSSAHSITIYGQTGSFSYSIPPGDYMEIGRLNIALFVESDGSLWLNSESALVFACPRKLA